MRVRNLALILAVFGAAAGAAAFVVTQLPREGDASPLRPAPVAPAPAEVSPPLLPPAGAADATIDVRVTAGPEPIPGADVRLYAAPDAAGAPWRRAGEGRTDASGIARIRAPPGVYLAAARAPGLAPGRAEAVRPPGGGAARVDVVLEPPATLEGRATAPGGGPVAGARVRLVPLFSRWPGFARPSAPPEETAEVRTDAAGTFRAAGLTPGSWALGLEAAGYHPVFLPRLPVPGPAVAVGVEALGTLEGVVLVADGRPAAGATVRAASPDHAATATCAADGRFHLAAPPGSYAVLAVLGDRGGSAPAPAAVAAGATSHAAPILLGAAARVEGQITRGGRGAAGAEVVLLAHRTREIVARTVADAGGRFALGPLAPAAYDLAAAAPDASPAFLGGVTLGAGQRFAARVKLAGTGAVTGTVRDVAGHTLQGIRVRAAPREGGLLSRPPLEVRSDFEGRFRLAPLDTGRVEIVARADALPVGVARAVAVTEGRDAAVELVLPSAGLLAGRVSDGGRRPPAGTTVVVSPLRAGDGTLQTARAAADASGNFELPLPAGEYRIHAAPGDVEAAALRVAPSFARVEAGRTTRVELPAAPLAREAGVEILVLEPGGAPSPGATVTLSRPDDGRVALATEAGDDGRVRVDARMGFAGHPVTVRARNGGRSGATTVTLPEAGTIAIHLAPGGAVTGVVRGARAGFTLEVSSQPAPGSWRTLEVHRFAGEQFTLGDLPSEPLRLVARADDGRRGAAEVRIAPGETRRVEIGLR